MATSCCQHQPQPSSAGWELLNTPHPPRSLWVAPSCPFWTPQLLQGPEHEGPDGDCYTTRPGSLRSAEAPRIWLLLLPEANTACGERVLPQAWTHCAWWPEEPWLGQPGQDGGELSWATLPALGTNRADLLPLPVQLSLVVRLLEAAGFASLRHLDPVLEGRPGDGARVRCSWGIHQAQDFGSSPETPLLLALSSRTQVWPAQPPAQDPGSAPSLTWAAPLCCSCTRCTPPACRSPSGPEAPSCYPAAAEPRAAPQWCWSVLAQARTPRPDLSVPAAPVHGAGAPGLRDALPKKPRTGDSAEEGAETERNSSPAPLGCSLGPQISPRPRHAAQQSPKRIWPRQRGPRPGLVRHRT